MDIHELNKLLANGSEKKILHWFKGTSEKERREVYGTVSKCFKETFRERMIEKPKGTFFSNPRMYPVTTAWFCVANFADVKKVARGYYPSDELLIEIIEDRKPDWMQALAEHLLNGNSFWMSWHFVRYLLSKNLIERPTNPNYYLGMIQAAIGRLKTMPLLKFLESSPDLLEHEIWMLFELDGTAEVSFTNADRWSREEQWGATLTKLASRGKLDRKRLFEASLSALDRDFNHYRASWFFEFFDLLEPTDAELKKYADRFLHLMRAAAPNVATWAFGKVKTLAKKGAYSTAAITENIDSLLRSKAKGEVLDALKFLAELATQYSKDTGDLVNTVAIALLHEKGDVQLAAFKLLEKWFDGESDSNVKSHIVELLQRETSSLAPSTKKVVNSWLSREGSASTAKKSDRPGAQRIANAKESLKDIVKGKQQAAPSVAALTASLSKDIQSLWSIDTLVADAKEGIYSLPAVRFDGTDVPRLSHLRPLIPLKSVEELIDVTAQVIEDGTRVDDCERCIDALVRLVDKKPVNLSELTAPLMKRIKQLLKKGALPFAGLDPGNDLLGMFYSFCTGEKITASHSKRKVFVEIAGIKGDYYGENWRKPIGFLSRRCLAISQQLARGESGQLLSIPSHEQGWIDPTVLAERVLQWNGNEAEEHDLILAMLRLAPENRSAALKLLANKNENWVQPIRFALGDESVPIGENASLWIAAMRAKSPWGECTAITKKFPDLGPDAAHPAVHELTIRKRKSGPYTFYDPEIKTEPACPKTEDPMLVTVMLNSARGIGRDLFFELGGFGGKTVGTGRWSAMIWPIARESYFAGAAETCLSNLDWWEAQWQNRAMLEPLLDPKTPLLKAGLYLLVGMLSAKEPGEAGLATDIAIRAIEEGQLGGDNFSEMIKKFLGSGLIKCGRWQKSFSTIAAHSPLHAAVVQYALQHALALPAASQPKDFAKLLELLYELSVEHDLPIVSTELIAILQNEKASGKIAKLTKSLLEQHMNDERRAAAVTIMQIAIELRCTKAKEMQNMTF